RDRAAAHVAPRPQLSRRRRDLGARQRVPARRRPPRGAGNSARGTHLAGHLPARTWPGFRAHENHGRRARRRGRRAPPPPAALPLFVRGGAILALGPVVQHLTGYAPSALTLLVYPERKSASYPEGVTVFPLYEDDGETNAYQNGRHATTFIECEAGDGRATI